MRSSNPVLGRAFNNRGYASMGNTATATTPESLENLYNAPAASALQTGRMTIEDVVARTSILFGILVVTGAVAWTANLGGGALMVGFLQPEDSPRFNYGLCRFSRFSSWNVKSFIQRCLSRHC
jgi:uncharacterized YccA/Bax inhibitor family protein